MMKKIFLTLIVLALCVTVSGCLGTTTEDTDVPVDNGAEVLDEDAGEAPEGDAEGTETDEDTGEAAEDGEGAEGEDEPIEEEVPAGEEIE